MAKDWKKLPDGKEKYNAYLCSREWSVLKEAVHKRAGGMCERCRVFPIDAVHHTTYIRQYKEELDDLQGNCRHCHAFTHGKSEHDPLADHQWISYMRKCKEFGRTPVDQGIAWKLEAHPTLSVFEFIQDRTEELYRIWEMTTDEACSEALLAAANEYERCGDVLQRGLEQDYVMWVRSYKPHPTSWEFTWADLI